MSKYGFRNIYAYHLNYSLDLKNHHIFSFCLKVLTSHDGVVVWQREGGVGRYESLCCTTLSRHPRKGWEFEPLLVTCIHMLTIFFKIHHYAFHFV